MLKLSNTPLTLTLFSIITTLFFISASTLLGSPQNPLPNLAPLTIFDSKPPKSQTQFSAFFRNHGFSDTQLHHLIQKAPWLLSCDPCKRVLPKFQFFASKVASTSHIVNLITKNPRVLHQSLENQLVPSYELVFRFLKSDKDTIAFFKYNTSRTATIYLARNIRVLIENGVTESNIARLLRISRFFNTSENGMLKVVEELKDLGFHPSKSYFAIALQAKVFVSATLWNEKSDVFKKWGWSDKDIMDAFRRQPHCMLASIDKINSVMSFWVNQLGWDALALSKDPKVIGCSLERRIIPRATIVQYLLKKGVREKNASLTNPFNMPEKLFLDKYIKCFKEESSYLLNLYEEKLNLEYTMENTTGMS